MKTLRVLHDNIETYIRNLKSLQVTAETYGTMLVPCILKQMPNDIQLEVTKNLQGDSWDFDKVLEIFNFQLTAREKCAFVGGNGKLEGRMKPLPQVYPQTFALLATTEKNRLFCILCEQAHKAWHCKVVTDVNARKKMVLDQKRCLNCLRRFHIAKNCTSKFICYKCNDKHNTCMCDAKVKSDHGMTTTEIEDSSLVAMVGRTHPGGEPVLLKTSIVSLSDISNENDDASSRTYITQQLANDLKIRPK